MLYKTLLLTLRSLTWGLKIAFLPAETGIIVVSAVEYPAPAFTTITSVILLLTTTGLKIAPVPTPDTLISGVE